MPRKSGVAAMVRVLLLQGVQQLSAAGESLPDRDWHPHDLGSLFTEVLSLCWKHQQQEIEKDAICARRSCTFWPCFLRDKFWKRCTRERRFQNFSAVRRTGEQGCCRPHQPEGYSHSEEFSRL